MVIKKNELMSKHTTYKLGGPADLFIQVRNLSELKRALNIAKDMPVFIIGNGSNLIFTDKGFRGCVIKLSMNRITAHGSSITAEAGATTKDIIEFAIMNNLAGLECVAGIPATVGGLICMNAGFTKEIGNLVKRVKAIDYNGIERYFKRDEIGFGYRKSIFLNKEYIILEATFELNSGNCFKTYQAYLEKRKKNQPIEFASCGSVFKKNALVSFQGLKKNDAEVRKSYIINHGKATASDVLYLIDHIQKQTKAELEAEIVGER